MSVLQVQLLREDAIPPKRAHPFDAGYDLAVGSSFRIRKGATRKVNLGYAVAIPEGHVGLVCPRSGLAAEYSITVLNAPGIIDANYRGEMGVLLVNGGDWWWQAEPGQRIAQLVIVPVAMGVVSEVLKLPESPDERAQGGFGSSGL